jgi:hypothetical protein
VPDHYVMIGPGWDADNLTSCELYIDMSTGAGLLLAITNVRSAVAADVFDAHGAFSVKWTGRVDRSLDWQEEQAAVAYDKFRAYRR